MKLSLILAPLIAAKVPHDVILDAVKAFEDQQIDALEKRRANDRERQARKRLSRDVTGSHAVSRSRAGVEDSSSKKVISGKKDNTPAAPTPRAELEKVLDSEHAAAVVEHRQRIKKPLTAYAARKLANSLSKAPDANAAADIMVEKGWQSFEVAWLENRAGPRPHSTASPTGGSPKTFDEGGHGPKGQTKFLQKFQAMQS